MSFVCSESAFISTSNLRCDISGLSSSPMAGTTLVPSLGSWHAFRIAEEAVSAGAGDGIITSPASKRTLPFVGLEDGISTVSSTFVRTRAGRVQIRKASNSGGFHGLQTIVNGFASVPSRPVQTPLHPTCANSGPRDDRRPRCYRNETVGNVITDVIRCNLNRPHPWCEVRMGQEKESNEVVNAGRTPESSPHTKPSTFAVVIGSAARREHVKRRRPLM